MNLSISSRDLRVELDENSGQIVRVYNRNRDLELIDSPHKHSPFAIELAGAERLQNWVSFHWYAVENGYSLIWEVNDQITFTSHVLVRGGDILISFSINNRSAHVIDRILYPIICGIGRIGGKGKDVLLHSHATGMLFHDPLELFTEDPANLRRIGDSPYPEGFSGSTMQFMAFQAQGKGGFFLGTEDSRKETKWFNVNKVNDRLCASFGHRPSNLTAPLFWDFPYPVVISALSEGSWYEAANRYRDWAINQPWAQPAPQSAWLRKKVGICTFGINARYDRSAWLDRIHKMAGTPVFHILGPNWAKWGHDYYNNIPRGKSDWFPAVFDASNMGVIRENGDYWAPFEFDLLANHSDEYPDPILDSQVILSNSKIPLHIPDQPAFPFMCPGTEYWQTWHVERDCRLVGEYGADALYYDISVSNLLQQCVATNHLHPPASGTPISDEFTHMYHATQKAASCEKGRRVPFGTEVISEIYANVFDFYQARAEAGPYSPFEVQAFRDWLIEGKAEKIPLFTYVFGNRAPLRMDGWARPSIEAGDLFYWTCANVLINGGLLELNYEFSALEQFDDHIDDPAQHYYHYPQRHYTFDPSKEAFVGQVAKMRTGSANSYLSQGAMLPAPKVDATLVNLPFSTLNVFHNDPIFEQSGVMQVPSAIAGAWSLNGRTAWIVANILDKPQLVLVDGKQLSLGSREIRLVEL